MSVSLIQAERHKHQLNRLVHANCSTSISALHPSVMGLIINDLVLYNLSPIKCRKYSRVQHMWRPLTDLEFMLMVHKHDVLLTVIVPKFNCKAVVKPKWGLLLNKGHAATQYRYVASKTRNLSLFKRYGRKTEWQTGKEKMKGVDYCAVRAGWPENDPTRHPEDVGPADGKAAYTQQNSVTRFLAKLRKTLFCGNIAFISCRQHGGL